MITHGHENSRSKDVYDLAVFLPNVDALTLNEALKRSFGFRATELPKSFFAALNALSTDRLERGWDGAVGSIPGAMSFKTAFQKVLKLIGELEGNQ
jgi:hypothetical protein